MTDISRLEALEFKAAYLEKTVHELSDALYRQQQEIDRLREQHQTLVRHVEALAENGNGVGATDFEPPPHY